MDKLRVLGLVVLLVVLTILGFGILEVAKRVSSERPTLNERKVEISGSWLSNEDPLYTVNFNGDGTYQDIYDGETLDTGEWNLLSNLDGEGWEETPDFQGAPFLKKTTGDGEAFHYAVVSMSLDELELFYFQGNGSLLSFSRIQ